MALGDSPICVYCRIKDGIFFLPWRDEWEVCCREQALHMARNHPERSITVNENQKKQKEEARKLAIENTYNVCATGEKEAGKEYSEYGNEINNE